MSGIDVKKIMEKCDEEAKKLRKITALGKSITVSLPPCLKEILSSENYVRVKVLNIDLEKKRILLEIELVV